MALDGIFLSLLKSDLHDLITDSLRIDKITQPNRYEVILALRSKTFKGNLLISTRTGSSRIGFIDKTPENPAFPPMFCMLLRKHLVGAKVTSIIQPELERVLIMTCETYNEIGDKANLQLSIEMIGAKSNIILINENGRIMDAIRRSDPQQEGRLLLHGAVYELPTPQNKINLLTCNIDEIMLAITSSTDKLDKQLAKILDGTCPLICRELAFNVLKNEDKLCNELNEEELARLTFYLQNLKDNILNRKIRPTMVYELNNKPIDFAYINISQYGMAAKTQEFDGLFTLLNAFYGEREQHERRRVKAQSLFKLLTSLNDRISRKINKQLADLKKCNNKEQLRINGELLKANISAVKRGSELVTLQNFYNENKDITVKLNPILNTQQNAEKYFKDYKKLCIAEKILVDQIEHSRQELIYIDSIFDSLTRADTEPDFELIRLELAESGYLRLEKSGKKSPKAPKSIIKQVEVDGYKVLIGKNNKQNDEITLKIASKNDIWFHTKDIPGSHVIIRSDDTTPTEETLLKVAGIAAAHSKSANGSNVPVDYTFVKYVKKPSGAKYGMVIYTNQKTLYVQPLYID